MPVSKDSPAFNKSKSSRTLRRKLRSARSGGRALKQERVESVLSVSARSQWRAQEGGDQPARSPWPPRRQRILEGHHEGVLHAACGRSRVPGVMTTTLRVNAQELQVSTTVEENARDAPAWGSRAASSQQPIASALEKLQPAL
eukprot:scaffold61924_cov61-Phaeocystis_antarctica.AAC.3